MTKLVKIPTSTQNSGAGKKNTARKKNTQFLLTHSILSENDTKVIFSRNKKKYGTFGVPIPHLTQQILKPITQVLVLNHRGAGIQSIF